MPELARNANAQSPKMTRSISPTPQNPRRNPNRPWRTSDDYSAAMVKFLPEAVRLSEMDEQGVRCAFNLLLYLAWNAYGDIDASFKMSGYGECEETYPLMDEQMMKIIDLRAAMVDPCTSPSPAVIVPHRWTDEDACVGEFKTGRPNKQQRNQIARQHAAYDKKRNELARERRETVTGTEWINNAIDELTESRDYIEPYGHDGFFTKSITRLEELRISLQATNSSATNDHNT
ncbi:hypothetical protein BGW36DRAFT_369566 [Talaromyces proteolyticus]|uniref:Uncharacterized protein n=1 Tax=Talaromyces proteolyticus TaxID=1131652 RepID=A0AAD4Q2D7_9EURO|nr:uncharacterized protein BGW36DRAFT_369566 [Talaromyces proteolyticus]KAH8703577.1 hypothetical protein BGW36DRAFT_369566 [Talaromyces proteolyticus]